MVKITFPDGSTEEHKDGITPAEIAKMLGKRLFKDALAAKVNGEIVDLSHKIEKDSKIEILTFDHKEGKDVYWHSSSHILAAAVKILFPNAKFAIGPSIEEGFYYDFNNVKFSEEDLVKIEEEMKKIIKKDLPFERKVMTKKEAKVFFGKENYKLELINELEEDKVTVYQLGDFFDFCKGPHVPSSGKIGLVKLLRLAGAYWRGDSKNPMLQRIYGISFQTEKQLEAFIELRKKAEEFDHRNLGQRLDLYSFQEEAPGMIFLHPKGMIIWNELLKFWREEHKKRGYQEIKTPVILSKKLWEISGHWDHYKDNMYFTKIDEADYGIKPMNCGGAVLIYKNTKRSYRELPLRLAEIGLVHRHELSGVLSGLFRVRSFYQDDAHIFCTKEQVEKEIREVFDFVDYFYKTFGLEYIVKLATKPEDYMGSDELWMTAIGNLDNVLKIKVETYNLDEVEVDEAGGVFYGPKIDFHVKDSLGRTWQLATIQLDFQIPERFDLTYVGEDNKPHRVTMIHRVIYGALERFLGIIIEHYGGNFPLWLSPIQVRILPVTDRNFEYAEDIKEELLKNDIRVEIDYSSATVEYKVRNAELQKIPYSLTVGDKEIKNKTIAVRGRDGKVKYNVKLDDFLRQILDEIKEKK